MAEAVKALWTSQGPAKAVPHKDKLASKKQQEREVHEALKQAQREKKEGSKQAAAEAKALLKQERMLHDTKRAHADLKRQQHREHHKETGQMCEHGVWRCSICFPTH